MQNSQLHLFKFVFLLLVIIKTADATESGPAIWQLEYNHKISWLFGTMHASTQQMRNEASIGFIKEKIAQARRLITEVNLAQYSPEQQQALTLKVALLNQSSTLKQSVQAKTWKRLMQYQRAKQIPENAFMPYTPWFVALQISIIEGQIAGFDFSQPIDEILMQHARVNEISIMGLESLEQQLAFFANYKDSEQMLADTLAQIAENKYSVKHLADMWQRGDTAQLTQLLTEDLQAYASNLFLLETLLKQRNQSWLNQLMAEIKQGNTVIAVGLMHMIGPDSLIRLLEQQGVTINRLSK